MSDVDDELRPEDGGGPAGRSREDVLRWTPADLVELVRSAATAMEEQALGLDRLDDVDDGDCGANLVATMQAVVGAVEAVAPPLDFARLCRAVAGAPAAGTSGLILVALIGGWGDALANHDDMDGLRLALALEAGCDRAEGIRDVPPSSPMFEVARAAAVAALDVADRDGTLSQVAGAAVDAAMEALEATSSHRPELAEAGVVDAGAAGWAIVLESLAVLAGGHEEPVPYRVDGARYEVRLQLAADDPDAGDRLAAIWSSLGEEVEVSPTATGTWDAFVATDDIGAVIEAAIALGRPSRVTVEDRVQPA